MTARWIAAAALAAAGCGIYFDGDRAQPGADGGADGRGIERPDASGSDSSADAATGSDASVGSDAAPTALRVLVMGGQEAQSEADLLRGALLADPGIGEVDEHLVESWDTLPPALDAYDAVVFWWTPQVYLTDDERIAFGNALADYVDGGGGVVTLAYAQGPEPLLGRMLSAGYEPLRPPAAGPYAIEGDARIDTAGATDPLLAGIAPVVAGVHPVSLVDPQAVLVASWDDGQPAVARKGRVISLGVRIDPTDLSLSGGWQDLLDRAAVAVAR